MNMWTSCVDGIPDGINVAIGELVSDAFTCFCSEELCNVEHFCDDCVVESTFTVTYYCIHTDMNIDKILIT